MSLLIGQGIIQVRTGVVVENNWTYVAGPSNWTYDVRVLINGNAAYTKQNLLHYHHARWRLEFWSKGAPKIHIGHDPAYLTASGAVPNYDAALIGAVDRNIIQQNYSGFDPQPMGLGLAEQYMPSTGASDEIGVLPRWTVLYLFGQDIQAKKATQGMGDPGGSWSIHYRDERTGLPVTIDDHPYICSPGCNLGDTRNPITGQYEITPGCPTCGTLFGHDTAHQLSFAYLPYLVTGEQYYMEELQFWAGYNLMDRTPAYRSFSQGLVHRDQERGQAWTIRTLGHAAYITPDNHSLKRYFEEKLGNNLEQYNNLYVLNPPNDYGAMSPYYSYPTASPWMDDFFTAVMGVLVELGYPGAQPVRNWKAKFPVRIFVGFLGALVASVWLMFEFPVK